MAENSNNSNSTFSIQGFNLVTLLKRLEAATSRLEDVTVYQEHFVKRKVAAATATDASATAIAPAIAPAPPAPPAPVAAAAPSVTVEEVSKAVKEFDAFITDKIVPYVEASKKIDSVLGEQAECFHNAILKERNVLHAASKSKKIALDDDKFQTLALVPINENIMKVIQLKDDNRSSKYFNYLNAVAEGVPVLGWIVTTTPVSYVPDFKDSAQFWTNRVLKDCKGKDDESEGNDWVKKFLGIFDELKNYVKEYQTTGLTFGGSEEFENAAAETAASTASPATATASAPAPAPAPVAGGAPPPPPPPPPPPADLFAEEKSGNSSSGEVGMGAVFAELNKGEGITSGLKKVDKSQMTHKNPELRKKAVPMPPKKPKNLTSASSVTSVIEEKKVPQKAKKAPQNELVDNKWMITHVTKADVPNGMITIDGSMDQSVYIGNCEGIVVQIKGKVNAISVNMSEKVGVVIEKAISSVELTKCKKCEVQVIDSVPIINVDQSDSTNVYLSETALGVEIYSSCCTALNVNIPDADAGADGDLKEVAISEQLVTRFDKQGGHTTEPVVHG
jgi:adenylyl cyclase-associated protein